MRDPYVVLGVKANASPDEIKAAWRNAAKKVHPDQNPDDPAAVHRFTEIGRAYDVLKDPEKRRRYDRAKATAAERKTADTYMDRRMQEQARAAEEAKRKAERAAARADDPVPDPATEDLVSKIFGHARDFENQRHAQHAKSEAASDSAQRQSSSDQGASTGTSSDFQPREPRQQHDAPHLDPSVKPHTDEQAPSFVGGSARDFLTFLLRRLTFAAPPPEKAPDWPVDLMLDMETLYHLSEAELDLEDGRSLPVTLQPGMTEGSIIKLEGQGHKLAGMKRGDLLARIRLRPNRFFRVEGYNIITFQAVDIENAVLGCETMVETLDGMIKVEVPEWSGSDQVIVVEAKGLMRTDGTRGDLIVELRVMLWDFPDQKVTDLMRSLREGLFL